MNTHLTVNDNIDNIYRDVAAWLTVKNTGVRRGGNTQWQDGKHKASEDEQGSQSGDSCTMWKGEPGSQGENCIGEGNIILTQYNSGSFLQIWDYAI